MSLSEAWRSLLHDYNAVQVRIFLMVDNICYLQTVHSVEKHKTFMWWSFALSTILILSGSHSLCDLLTTLLTGNLAFYETLPIDAKRNIAIGCESSSISKFLCILTGEGLGVSFIICTENNMLVFHILQIHKWLTVYEACYETTIAYQV